MLRCLEKMDKTLYYYKGLHGPTKPFGGSSQATLTSAAVLKSKNMSIVCGGDRLDVPFSVKAQGQVLDILPITRQEDFSLFQTVIFANHLFNPQQSRLSHQKWILDQHSWGIDQVERERINDFSLILARSSLHRDHLITQGVPKEKVHVASNCIDTDFFKPTSETRNPYAFLFVGAVVEHKNVHILLEAFIRILESIPQATLTIAGSSSLWNDPSHYEDKLKSFNIPGVRFIGNVQRESLPSLYSSHSILVLPSTLESFGLVTIEAQSCGCIPVVHSCGGTPATLLHCSTGFLYKPNTPENLSITMKTALSFISHTPEIRERARRFVHETFSLQRLSEDWDKILKYT